VLPLRVDGLAKTVMLTTALITTESLAPSGRGGGQLSLHAKAEILTKLETAKDVEKLFVKKVVKREKAEAERRRGEIHL
jgi:hypothetical protein